MANQHGLKITGKHTEYDNHHLGKTFSSTIVTINKLFMQCNFLEAALCCVEYHPNEVIVYISSVCKAHKNLTGTNLKEYGIDDLDATFG